MTAAVGSSCRATLERSGIGCSGHGVDKLILDAKGSATLLRRLVRCPGHARPVLFFYSTDTYRRHANLRQKVAAGMCVCLTIRLVASAMIGLDPARYSDIHHNGGAIEQPSTTAESYSYPNRLPPKHDCIYLGPTPTTSHISQPLRFA